MSQERYTIIADAFALSTTPKTALMIIAGSLVAATIVELGVSINAASGRCLVELFESTQATTGSGQTSTGAKQLAGFTAGDTSGPTCTYGREYTGEPTVLTVLKSWWFPAPGPFVIQFPLGREIKSLVSGSTKYKAIGIRLSVDTGTPTCEAYLEWEE